MNVRKLVDMGFVVELWLADKPRLGYVALITLGHAPAPQWCGSGSSPDAAARDAYKIWAEDNPGHLLTRGVVQGVPPRGDPPQEVVAPQGS